MQEVGGSIPPGSTNILVQAVPGLGNRFNSVPIV